MFVIFCQCLSLPQLSAIYAHDYCVHICTQLLYLPTLCASFQSSTVSESGFPTVTHHCCVVSPVQTTEIHHCCLHWIVCSIEHVLRVSTLCSLSFSCEDTVCASATETILRTVLCVPTPRLPVCTPFVPCVYTVCISCVSRVHPLFPIVCSREHSSSAFQQQWQVETPDRWP